MKIRIGKISFNKYPQLKRFGDFFQLFCRHPFSDLFHTKKYTSWPSTCKLRRTQSWHIKQASSSQKVLPRTQFRHSNQSCHRDQAIQCSNSTDFTTHFQNLMSNLQSVILPIFHCSSSLRTTKAHNVPDNI